MHALAASLENELITGSRSAFCPALPRRDKNNRGKKMENGRRERRRRRKEVWEGENGRRKKGQRQRKRRERGKVEKKRENRDRCIRRRVSQIRNLLTMVRKAIHLDDRGESVIYWPVTPAPTWATTILSIYIYIYTTRHVVSEARLLKKRRGLAHSWLLFPSLSLSLLTDTMDARLFTLLPN